MEFIPESFDLSCSRAIARPLTVAPDTPVLDAIAGMSSRRDTSCVLVVLRSRLLGIFTQRDVVKLTAALIDLSSVKIAAVMTQKVVTLTQSKSQNLFAALSLIRQHQISHLPILDEGGQLVGVVTPNSICQVLQATDIIEIHKQLETQTERLQIEINKRQRIEAVLLQAHEELEKRVEARTADLKAANAQLQQEIDRRRQAQEQIQFQANVLSQVNDGVIAIDNEHRVTYWNRAAERLYLVKADEIIGRQLEESHQYRWLKKEDELAARDALATGGWWRGENIHIKKNGEEIYVEASVSVLKDNDGAGIGFLAVIRDISLSKAAQAQIAFQASLLDQVRNAVIATDNDGKITYWNQFARQLYQLTPRVMGKSILEVVPPAQTEVAEDIMAGIKNNGSWEGEFTVRRKDGSTFPAYVADTIIRDASGNPCGIVGVSMDITERKRVETELVRQNLRSQLFAEVTLKIRQSLQLEEILQTTVNEVQRILACDRAVIFQLKSDGSGRVVQEAVVPGWPAILGHDIVDPCFKKYQEQYRGGRILALADIDSGDIQPCHVELLRHFGVKANLIVPILIPENEDGTTAQETQKGQNCNNPPSPRLWGLLIAHQCAYTREWSEFETSLLQQLANQVGIAITQSQLIKALRKSEEQVRLALEFTRIGCWDWELNTGKVTWSENNFRLLDLVPGEVEPSYQIWRSRVHPSDIDRVEQALRDALQNHTYYEAEYRVIHRDGSLHWVVARGRGIYDAWGQAVRMVGVIIDISDRKNASQKIREQAALLDVATEAILVQDLDNQILYWNKGAERLYGYLAVDAQAKKANELLYKEPSPQRTAAMKTVIECGSWQGELHQVTKDGKEIIVESCWTLVRDEQEQPKSLLAVNTDITDKKQLESQLLRAQRLESIGTLAGGIAHDLNNILTPILMSAQLMAMKFTDEKTQQRIKLIETNAKRGADLIRQVLTFARGMEGKRVTLEVGHVLREIKQVIERTFPKSIQIYADIHNGELWTVSADTTQLHQVFMNLCINARDAMPNGGVLRIFAQNLIIDESYAMRNIDAQVGCYVVGTIADTGIGMEPAIVDRIFDPFFTTKEVGAGTGLGLSTALGIVKNHGGFIEVNSKVGSGSEFKVFLPAERAKIATQLAAATVKLPRGNGELILVVDDEAGICELAKTVLETCAYRVLTANDGSDAIALYTRHRDEIKAVIIDTIMPSMDGLTCIRTLKAINPQERVIAMSGLATAEAIAKATNLGIQAFLPKPFTTEELINTLHQI